MNESLAKNYFRQLAKAVKYMKDNCVLHRDLKPGNLFINNNTLKVGDFGCSIKLNNRHERRNSQLGTPNYLSPEVSTSKEYSFSCDVWSIGCVLYIMLVGRTPFESKSVKET